MKHTLRNCVVLLVVPCFLLVGATDANAGMSKGVKIGVGIALLAGGIALGAHAANNFFSDTSNEAGAALVMIAAGTTFLIIGATEKKKPEEEAKKFREGLVSRSRVEILIGAAPIKKGWAAGMRIRW